MNIKLNYKIEFGNYMLIYRSKINFRVNRAGCRIE